MRHLLRFVPLVLVGLACSAAALAAQDSVSPRCVFCEIVAGRGTAAVVHRDDLVVAFLDIAPRNPGHVLVVPVAHADDIVATPAATAERMMVVAQRIARAIRRTDLRAEGFNFVMNTGRAAGQTVFHAHLHIMPRYAGDEPAGADHQRTRVTPESLAPIAEKIRAALEAETTADPAAAVP